MPFFFWAAELVQNRFKAVVVTFNLTWPVNESEVSLELLSNMTSLSPPPSDCNLPLLAYDMQCLCIRSYSKLK